MPTIKDVAKRAGVSHGTLSNVLKGVNTVSIENIKKVEKAIAELGYKPNTSAQQLKASTSNSIYFILPSITGSLYPQLFTQASKDLELQGFDVSLYITYENASTEQRILNFVSGMKPSCIVIATCQPQNTAQFNSILSGGTPIVFIEREPEGLDCNFVGFDNEQTLYDLTKELIKKDRSPIALLVYSEQYSSETLCVEGYRRAYEKYGGGFDLNIYVISTITNSTHSTRCRSCLH